jgi:DNA-binding NarL/FixJ family response regulator
METSTKPIRVLLADDHAVVRAGIRQFLEQADNISVIAEVDDGDAAKESISENQPDIAVLDIKMPGASGIELTRWIRAYYPQVGVLVLTAYEDEPYIKAVLQAGANGYVLKTASPREIIKAVEDIHAGHSALDPKIVQKIVSTMTTKDTQPSKSPGERPIEKLTDRELEVLALVSEGDTNKAIGLKLGISDRTVQSHLANIFEKVRASSRTEAVMRAVSLGWLEPPSIEK